MAKRPSSKSPAGTTAVADAEEKSPAKGGGKRFGKGSRGTSYTTGAAKNRHLVIVESPSKAKTINKYLGPEYLVLASVGHVRDLPSKNPKGVKSPVPGVDLEQKFKPTYEVLAGKDHGLRSRQTGNPQAPKASGYTRAMEGFDTHKLSPNWAVT